MSRTGKPEFTKLGQTYINMTEVTANIEYATEQVNTLWGAGHAIVSTDGIKIEDSPGTKGQYSCKLYSCSTSQEY